MRACSVQLRNYIIQYNFLMKSTEVSAEQLSGVVLAISGFVLAISGFIYIFVGGALFRVNTFENNVRL